jgi:hypothetical protein
VNEVLEHALEQKHGIPLQQAALSGTPTIIVMIIAADAKSSGEWINCAVEVAALAVDEKRRDRFVAPFGSALIYL